MVETVEKNLLLLPGASLSADSEESREFSAERARDGVSDDSTLRWSSANDWEQNDHWLQASFREPVTVGAVRIFVGTDECGSVFAGIFAGRQKLGNAETLLQAVGQLHRNYGRLRKTLHHQQPGSRRPRSRRYQSHPLLLRFGPRRMTQRRYRFAAPFPVRTKYPKFAASAFRGTTMP